MKKIFLIAFLCLLVPVWGFPADDWFVCSSGNGAGDTAGSTEGNCYDGFSDITWGVGGVVAGDTLYLCTDGIYREQLTVGGSGSEGNRITITAQDGEDPIIYGSTEVSGFGDEGDNIWSVTVADPVVVWFVNIDGSVEWGKEEGALEDVDTEYDWYHDGADLFVYSTTDPDTAYTSVEEPTRSYGITANGKDYITISNLEVAFSTSENVITQACDDLIIEYVSSHHVGTLNSTGKNFNFYNCANPVLRYCESFGAGSSGLFVMGNDGTISNAIIERNVFHDNIHANVDFFTAANLATFSGAIFRYNLVYDSNTRWDNTYSAVGLFVDAEAGDMTGVVIHNNVFLNTKGSSIQLTGQQGYDLTAPKVYNNTIYGTLAGVTNMSIGIYMYNASLGSISDAEVINNVIVDKYSEAITVNDSSWVSIVDYNLYDQSNDDFTRVDSTTYHETDYAAYTGATGWDTHSADLWGADPLFTNAAGGDFTLTSLSPAIGAGVDLGNGLLYGLDPTSTWPDNVKPLDQDDYEDWEIGAYIYIEAGPAGGPGTIVGGGSGTIAGGGSGTCVGTEP